MEVDSDASIQSANLNYGNLEDIISTRATSLFSTPKRPPGNWKAFIAQITEQPFVGDTLIISCRNEKLWLFTTWEKHPIRVILVGRKQPKELFRKAQGSEIVDRMYSNKLG